MTLSRLGVTPARGAPFAFLWTISVALCPSPRALPIAWCIPPVTSHLHCCVCRTTLQFSNDDPKECTNYIGSHLILTHGVQYNDRLYPTILEPWNHHGLLIDPAMGEPYPMEVVGDFRATGLIFKGCYGDSLLYSNADLG